MASDGGEPPDDTGQEKAIVENIEHLLTEVETVTEEKSSGLSDSIELMNILLLAYVCYVSNAAKNLAALFCLKNYCLLLHFRKQHLH